MKTKCEICNGEIDKKTINVIQNKDLCKECYDEAVNEARLEYGRIHNAERFI